MTMKCAGRVSLFLLAMTTLFGVSSVQAGTVRYVDVDAPSGGDGVAWATAYRDLQSALTEAAASSGTINEIRVAEGTYKPSEPVLPTPRYRTFAMLNGVAIRGGYAGYGQPNPDLRNLATQFSVLSGDQLGGDGPLPMTGTLPVSWSENSYHVITAKDVDNTAEIDGFVITHGSAQSGTNPDRFGGGIVQYRAILTSSVPGPTIRNCLLVNNYAEFGGGMQVETGVNTKIIGCTFRENRSSQGGGGMDMESSSFGPGSTVRNCSFIGNYGANGGGASVRQKATLTNCVFSGNTATGTNPHDGGGGLFTIAVQSNFTASNCTFAGNTAANGGGVNNSGGGPINFPVYNNCIVWGNTATVTGQEVYNLDSVTTWRHSDIRFSGGSSAWVGATVGTDGGGNKDVDPIYIDADLRLGSTSTCVDAGNNSLIPLGVTTDRDGNCRIINGTVDMGAYEKTQADSDGDGIDNTCDNCPTIANQGQQNTDGDALGDACDPCPMDALNDVDNDGICGNVDNCPTTPNPSQQNTDGDAFGDACDPCPMDALNDVDNDGVCGNVDNCPNTPNPDQANADGDAFGDACETCIDTDGDGFGNPGYPTNTCDTDNCPTVANADQADADNDGIGDACDTCTDTDHDGFGNPGYPANTCATDNCPTIPNSDQANFDGDAQGDACDADDDNDGLTDAQEAVLANGGLCPSPLNSDSDNDGLSDSVEIGMGFNPCNARPTANAIVQQLTAIGSMALVRLNGAGSSDADDAFSTLTFKWTIDANPPITGPAGTTATINVPLAYGVHNITLRVTDPAGGWHETSTMITLNSAQLSVFKIDTVDVNFGGSPQVAKLTGAIGLPFGVNHSELAPIGTANLVLSTVTIAPAATLTFFKDGDQQNKWRYANPAGPITRFDIDWEGARFKFSATNFPIEFESQLISSSQTILTIKYDKSKLGGGVTVNFNGQGSINISALGIVTSSSSISIDAPKPGKEATLTLPFPLTNTSVITVSGGLSRTIPVADYLTASVGRFRIDTIFNGALFPNGVNTLPRAVSATVTIGSEAYPGSDTVSAPTLTKENLHWIK